MFEWWRRRKRREREQHLQQEISENMPFLFSEFGGRFVANDEELPDRYHTTLATIEFTGLRLRGVSFRDEFHMEVAPSQLPKRWEHVITVLKAIELGHPATNPDEVPRLPPYFTRKQLAQLLKQRWPDLCAGLSEQRYNSTERIIGNIKELQWQEDTEGHKRNIEFYRRHPEAARWQKKDGIQVLGLKDEK